jgi:hypothetical protein
MPTTRAGATMLLHLMVRVNAIHQDTPFSKTTSAGVTREIKDLARWLRLDLDLPA